MDNCLLPCVTSCYVPSEELQTLFKSNKVANWSKNVMKRLHHVVGRSHQMSNYSRHSTYETLAVDTYKSWHCSLIGCNSSFSSVMYILSDAEIRKCNYRILTAMQSIIRAILCQNCKFLCPNKMQHIYYHYLICVLLECVWISEGFWHIYIYILNIMVFSIHFVKRYKQCW